eukprot:TRINITY_DN36073_c0_g1_i1.p1 TRINITY_DN36073_c0_g1~~TRINITY_DN36073_c0_g1_i1.p1  ORF type:complete len:623 (+),score=143.18 TRINITY_DN36073_c0_g1_i1:185-1870(+)
MPQQPGQPFAGYAPGAAGQMPPGAPQGFPPVALPASAGAPQATPARMLPGGCNTTAAPSGAADNGDQDREIERLRRESRKAEEKINFFRNQVISLQQQVSSMSAPVMAAQDATALPEELSRLRQELQEERTQRQALQQQLQQLQAAGFSDPAAAAAAMQDRAAELEAARAQVTRLERQLAEAHADISAARQGSACAPALPGGGNWSSQVTLPAGSFASAAAPFASTASCFNAGPFASAAPAVSSFASAAGGGLGDPLDPISSPGGQKRALIIGCDYTGKLGTLRAGVQDGLQWTRFFMKRCGLVDQDIRFLSDDQAQYQQKAHPESFVATRDNILRGLHWLVGRSPTSDEQLFLVFCGHGAQIVVEDRLDRKLCECAMVPTDVCDGGDFPRVVRDTEVNQALQGLPSGTQVTLINDSCHGGRPLDRHGQEHLTEYVGRGRVDYDKLRGHPVLPRFFELPQWKAQPQQPLQGGPLRCHAVHWSACANQQFCVELPIDERPRGVFTYIFISSLLKVGVQASSFHLLQEAQELTGQLKGRWRLQQDVQFAHSRSTSEQQPFLRF